MPLFQALATYLTGAVDAKAKFQVTETTVLAIAGLERVLEETNLALLKDKLTYKVVLTTTHFPKKAFVLFYSVDMDTSIDSFNVISKKIHSILECSQDLHNTTSLQKICDVIFQHPSYNSLQLAICANLMECITKTFASMVNEKDDLFGKSAILAAIETENKDVVNAVMCLSGVDLKAVDGEGSGIFHYAARTPDSNFIKMLASKDSANLNHMNNEGESALHEACKANKPDNVEMLMRYKVDPFMSKGKNYPLHTALHHNCVECVKVLVSWKAGILKLKSSDGSSALHIVSDKDMIEYLMDMGCNLEDRNNDGLTPLLLFILNNNYSACMALLTKGANILARDHRDNGALHFAVKSENETMIKLVVVFGADLSLCNADSISPRHIAANNETGKRSTMLYHLHQAGCSRCSHDKVNCNEGCRASGTDNGTKPPPTEGSLPKFEDVPYKVEDYTVYQSALDAAITRVREGYVVDRKKGTRCSAPGDRILCLDGGGIRGLVTILILKALENIAGRPLHELFDWISGTSTGGILAVGILQHKTLNYLLTSYFKYKNLVFVGKRPYDSDILEKLMKEDFGEYTKMTDLTKPKILLAAALVDRVPAKLHLFRNYNHPGVPHDSSPSPFKQFGPCAKNEDQYVWHALRATGAAPTFFRASGRFIDGGLISNNPTMDTLAEVIRYNEAVRVQNPSESTPPIHVVVSIGTGLVPVKFVEECDIFRPGALWDFSKIFTGCMNLWELLYHQTTSSDGSSISRASSWCNSINAPYFRFNPQMSQFIQLDCVDDAVLVQLLWDTHLYLQTCHDKLVQLVHLLT